MFLLPVFCFYFRCLLAFSPYINPKMPFTALMRLFALNFSIFAILGRVQSQDITPIEIKGSKFFYRSSGDQFFLKGVIYQQVPDKDQQGSVSNNLARSSADDLYLDPLSDASACERDIPQLVKLETNVVRSYNLDDTKTHDNCMSQFAKAGIYVLVDLAAPGLTVGNLNPTWNDALYGRYTKVVDAMHNYTNLLGFIVGDNVVKGVSADESGPYVKAAVRDMKAYIKQKNYRSIPVGYVNDVLQGNAAAIDPLSKDAWDYLNCGDANDTIDFFGANMLTFCKGSTYTDSGYNNATKELSNYSVPVSFAAYGCSQALNCDFSEIGIIYGFLMSPVWSGAIVYEYFMQGPEPGYGLVSVSGNSVDELSNFANVSSNLATVSPSSVNSASYTPSNTVAATFPSGAASTLPPNPRAAVVAQGISARTTSTTAVLNPSASSTPSASSQSGLSSGAKAGIGVAVAVLVIVAAVVAVFYLRHQRRQKQHQQIGTKEWTKTELAADDVDREARGYGPHMADPGARAEVEGTSALREAPTDRPILEKPEDGDTVNAVPEMPGLPHTASDGHVYITERR